MQRDIEFGDPNQKMEENRFLDACQMFYNIMRANEPNSDDLASLAIAEDEGRVEFRRMLCALFPNSFACNSSLINMLLHAGQAAIASKHASEMLLIPGLLEVDELQLRLIRFKCECMSHVHVNMKSDFEYIWTRGDSNLGVRKLRKSLIRDLACCVNESSQASLNEISALPFIGNLVKELIEAKSRELQILANWRSGGTPHEAPQPD